MIDYKVLITPEQSNTRAYIVQTSRGLEAACSGCGKLFQDIDRSGLKPCWACKPCGVVFNGDMMHEVSKLAVLPNMQASMTDKGIDHAKWVEIWTGLEVEVNIDGD